MSVHEIGRGIEAAEREAADLRTYAEGISVLIITALLGAMIILTTLFAGEAATPEADGLTEVEFVPGLLWNRTGRESSAPFEVITEAGALYMLKLDDFDTEADGVALLVRGGEPLEIDVPAGGYTLKYCQGETWYGEEHRFGPGETCSLAKARLDFDGGGITVTLYGVEDGNMETRDLDPDEF